MRTDLFDSSKPNWESDDITSALEHNPQPLLKKEDIKTIVAEVCGEADGPHWYWIIKRRDDKFIYVWGGCDYTGWDCQSAAGSSGPYETAEEAAMQAPEKEEYRDRWVRQALMRQLKDELPFAIYTNP